ncbi:hypothetical protein [Mesorhizobium sp.]|uniref:hypothetical protein n=1 Tax=Mesorhizobium sp. TaxID=1871066 RepID=UPI00257FD0DC|nr:hypothetical protein [Mesorhizobium sp.]
MAELETACYPIVKEAAFDRTEIERLSYRASALVDKGRLFFPNVENGSRSKDGDGTRVKLLDEVLRACYVARHLAHNGTVNNRLLREQVWEMRDRFIRLLQKEMSASLRPVDKQASGQSVALDPTSWSKPKRKLKLPGDETVP